MGQLNDRVDNVVFFGDVLLDSAWPVSRLRHLQRRLFSFIYNVLILFLGKGRWLVSPVLLLYFCYAYLMGKAWHSIASCVQFIASCLTVLYIVLLE